MEDKVKLAILGIVLVTSPMPAAMFLVFNDVYVCGLLTGAGGVRLDGENGWLEFYSKTARLIPLRLDFIEVTLLLASVVVFFVSLILIVKILAKEKEELNEN